ncbi:hypothetical protein N802_13635 [Knoellia sinensis KCTC 19936]|uniref:Uncharacterized protein n=1 Tax=Knoellia sinensis KCTC 19936 TaxID=1385520 RepID=A0A0A0IYF1_9MICO|nr:hypothetical protein [Knoellia sinensis]KGN29454.1 hypothetical protein N802_13635 [Knoellia sinensis KCTC 19936]
MQSVVVDVILALGTGVLLWAVLPRGVVLTRSARTEDWRGEPVYDTWALRNESAVPIRLTSVAVRSPDTLDAKGRFEYVELNDDNADALAVALCFDDAYLETTRGENAQAWKGIEVPPGDTLQAKVDLNRDLRIRYRRTGPTGVFERRQVLIHGHI